jgi:U3 small nucleolar RNA-associated protein 10
MALINNGQALMTPYMSFLLQPITQDLKAFNKKKLKDKDYWVAMLDVLTKSLSHDDGG